jgi:hypothetical protein
MNISILGEANPFLKSGSKAEYVLGLFSTLTFTTSQPDSLSFYKEKTEHVNHIFLHYYHT